MQPILVRNLACSSVGLFGEEVSHQWIFMLSQLLNTKTNMDNCKDLFFDISMKSFTSVSLNQLLYRMERSTGPCVVKGPLVA